jgi:hypothetical protein
LTTRKIFANQGDKVSPGETLFEVQTDKAVLAFDTEEEGVLAKILVSSFNLRENLLANCTFWLVCRKKTPRSFQLVH